jgi:hypothetical protein
MREFRFVFWDVLPCKIIVDRRFRGTCCLNHQGNRQYIPEDKSILSRTVTFISVNIETNLVLLYILVKMPSVV